MWQGAGWVKGSGKLYSGSIVIKCLELECACIKVGYMMDNHSWAVCILLRMVNYLIIIMFSVAASRNSRQGAAYGVVRQGVN